MKMLVTRVLAHGEGDPVITVGGNAISSDHGKEPQKIYQYEVWLNGDEGYARLMLADAAGFVEGQTLDVTFAAPSKQAAAKE